MIGVGQRVTSPSRRTGPEGPDSNQEPTLTRSGRIAYVGADRQLHVVDPDGGGRRQVTFSKVPGALSSWGGAGGDDASSWPSWSPDGRWLACFQGRGDEGETGPFAVCAVEVDGVEERQLVELDGLLPIYSWWNSRGDKLAILAQDDDQLQLWTCRLDEVGAHRVIDQGVPLFFSWMPDGERLLLHVGARDDRGRLVVRRADGQGDGQLFPDPPGSFCTPLIVGDRAVYVAGRRGESTLTVSDHAGHGAMDLAPLQGLLAVVPSPVGPAVAVAAAPRGETTPYQGIWVAPVEGGRIEQVSDEDCMAFFWTPDGRRIIYARLDLNASCMRWRCVDVETGKKEDLGPFWPSRDQLFYLHFFEQYAVSHPLVTADSRTLVFASHPDPGDGEVGTTCQIIALDLDAPVVEHRVLAEGTFAVCSPAPLRSGGGRCLPAGGPMPLSDILAAALSRPAGRVVEGPVRNIVNEVLADHGYASPAEVAALRADIDRVRGQVAPLVARLDALEARQAALQGESDALRAALAAANDAAAAARAEAAAARAEADRPAPAAPVAVEPVAAAQVADAPAEVEPVAPPAAVEPVAAAPAAAEPEAAPARPASPAVTLGDPGAVGCRVSDCAASHHADGFCRDHFSRWRAGRLPGFVGPEGLLEMAGQPHRVAIELAGQPFTVSERDGRLRVAGRFASATAL